MEFIDLKAQYKVLKEKINQNIEKVLTDGNYIMGEEVKELEEKLAEYVGVKYCATCANGTDALQIALMCYNVGKGDAIFVPSFTFFSTAEVVSAVGATPIFIDSDERSFNIVLPKEAEGSALGDWYYRQLNSVIDEFVADLTRDFNNEIIDEATKNLQDEFYTRLRNSIIYE